MTQKKISLLGSTGSIGKNTLEVVRYLGEEYQIVALAAKSNIDLLEEQARLFSPKLIAVYDKAKALELQRRLPSIRIVGGMEGLEEAAAFGEATHVVSAVSGTVGIRPTFAALNAGKILLLANKEALVSAGECLMSLAAEKGCTIIPVDSEHSALFQCLNGRVPSTIHRLLITASGGPFYFSKPDEITVESALAHPNWRMGPKITIDCSTLMNKGLEVIEAHYLFALPIDKIGVVIHPKSIVHGLVQFIDGSTIAQLSNPHMIYPIEYALTHPERRPSPLPHLDLTACSPLEFYPPDLSRFPCLDLALTAGREGGSLPCYMNGANDVLVEQFLNKKISWDQIGKKLEKLMEKHTIEKDLSLEKVLAIDATARKEAMRI